MMIPSQFKTTFCFIRAAVVIVCVGAAANAQSGDRYQRWLDEDVRYIITPDESATFVRLPNNDQRDHFIEQFWLRRSPTPDSTRNPYKEEHYRRLAYANVHFAQAIPGWKTDRGRIYIVYGTPDRVKVGGTDSVRPTEVWHYRSIPGQGTDIDFKFIDVCSCGDYRLETQPKN
jgi:GWxTD domain-containing protein